MVAVFFWCCSEWHADDTDTKVARMVADFLGGWKSSGFVRIKESALISVWKSARARVGTREEGIAPHQAVLLRRLLSINKSISLLDRKSTRLNSSHVRISYAVFCL